jgi:hypothetical protein
MVKEALSIKLSSTDAEQLLRWYKFDLSLQITQAQADSSTADAHHRILALKSQLLANTERLSFAQRFDQLLGATDMNIELQKHSNVPLFSAMMTAAHPEQVVDISPVIDQIEALPEASRSVIENDIIRAFIYAYEDVETKNLEQHQSVLNEESSKKFNRIVVKSMSTTIEVSSLNGQHHSHLFSV